MQSIIYDVAVSIDGFIAGPSGDVSLFAHEGPIVEDYQSRLAGYKTAIMGRSTYEFAYQFGMKPGDNPYPHMKTVVFSRSITMSENREVDVITSDTREEIRDLKANAKGPIYLCGGGNFAGNLLKLGLVDKLIIKRAPIILGSGTPLFNGIETPHQLEHITTKTYEDGYLLQEFNLNS